MTFSYLSRGIQKLFHKEHTELSRDGGLFVSRVFEKDREHFHKVECKFKKPKLSVLE